MYRQQGFDSFGTSTHKDNIGYFVEKEHKHEFTYRLTNDPWALAFGFKHECDVGSNPQEVRFCTVKKTRVDVCVLVRMMKVNQWYKLGLLRRT